ncbi:hypothetical protein BS47DRAFT_1316788 [Hydnum rufescens UP504]|uniref:Translation initiation factor eIF2B subunit beta n=1 Tax=Hydnum rufescens UP504 TaxID=1448309 RepID=A0A9P6AYN3_9AGAM|nr:hypothetical protein BS47DRAFT_1316788 [Hydnum rufescens UP504]
MPASTIEVKDKASQRAVDVVVAKLRRRQIFGSHETALETVLLLRQVVAAAKFNTIDQLLDMVRRVGRRLVEAQPREQSVGNIVRKVLKLIRDEYAAVAGPISQSGTSTPQLPTGLSRQPWASSVANFVLLGHPRHQGSSLSLAERSGNSTPVSVEGQLLADESNRKVSSIKPALIDAIQEVIDELETVYESVARNARDHIHSDDIVLTIGKSRTVESFLKAAARDRKFIVIVAETAPSYVFFSDFFRCTPDPLGKIVTFRYLGREMASSLSSAGISTVLVPDSCLYALMSRVNKVIIGAHAVMANGGMFAIAGSLVAASAARAHSTPVIVCTGQFKLTPLWNLHYQYASVDVGDPERVLSSVGDGGDAPEGVDIINPWFDYVKPELVDVLITNYGDHPPAYVYRLVKETYDDEDIEI